MDLCHDFPPPPEPAFRAPLKVWCDERAMSINALAKAIGVAQQRIERNILPPDHPRFRPASDDTRQLVEAFTRGAVAAAEWPEPPSFDAPPASDVAEPSAALPPRAAGGSCTGATA